MYTSLDRAAVKRLRTVLEKALENAGFTELGIVAQAGHCSFDTGSATFKVELAVQNEDGNVMTKEAVAFQRGAAAYGLRPDDLFREFTWQNEKCQIVGLKPRSTKYPFLVKKENGKTYKWPLWMTQNALKQENAK